MRPKDEIFNKMKIAEEEGLLDFSYIDSDGQLVEVHVKRVDPIRYYEYNAGYN